MDNENEKIVVGLDIGTTKICAVVGRKNEYGKLEVLGMGKALSDGVVRGVVSNIDKTVAAIEEAVAQTADQSGINIELVNVGIAGQHINSTVHRGSITRESMYDEISIEDVRRLTHDMYKTVIPPGNEIIHVMPQDYTVDYEEGIKDPVGMRGSRLEADFHIITAKANDIFNVSKCVKKSGLSVDNLILEPLASSLAVLSKEEKDAGVCLVDIGGGTTDIAIFHENIIRHTSVIPLGGNIITEDIKHGCMVMENQAEQLKVKFGKAIAEETNPNEIVSIPGFRNRPSKEISVMNLAHIIEARMEEIIELVHNEIINSGYDKRLTAGIVITGGGALLSNCRQLFEYMTGLDARIGHPNEHLGKSKVEEVKSPMYSTAVGLVLNGFRCLDDRDTPYLNYEEAPVSSSTPKQGKKIGEQRTSQPKTDNSWWRFILNKTKDIITNDVDDTY